MTFMARSGTEAVFPTSLFLFLLPAGFPECCHHPPCSISAHIFKMEIYLWRYATFPKISSTLNKVHFWQWVWSLRNWRRSLRRMKTKIHLFFLFFWITIKKSIGRGIIKKKEKTKTTLKSGAKPLGGDPSVCMVSEHPWQVADTRNGDLGEASSRLWINEAE